MEEMFRIAREDVYNFTFLILIEANSTLGTRLIEGTWIIWFNVFFFFAIS